jgi:hypothetical protein
MPECNNLLLQRNIQERLSGIWCLWGGDVNLVDGRKRAKGPRVKALEDLSPKSLQEIAVLLYMYGYIKCPDKWLGIQNCNKES